MQAKEIHELLQQNFRGKPGYDDAKVQKVSDALAHASSTVAQAAGAPAVNQPTAQQQKCYAACARTRDEALAAAALKGFPFGMIAAAAAIAAFNACRHNCDQP